MRTKKRVNTFYKDVQGWLICFGMWVAVWFVVAAFC